MLMPWARGAGSVGDLVVYSDQLGQPFVKRMSEILGGQDSKLRFTSWSRLGLRVVLGPRPAAIQVQWSDVVLRRKRTTSAVLGSLKMLGFLVVLRLSGIRAVIYFHNAAGKGHARVRLDRALRTALVAVADAFIVLNEGAVDVVEKELVSCRRKFASSVHVVPHPVRILDHGPRRSIEDARDCLSIASELPLVVQIPGANQGFNEPIADPSRRYSLIFLARSKSAPFSIESRDFGYVVTGRVSNEQFGLLICAADAVLLTDPAAFASATLHASVDLDRPVIAPRSPASLELGDLGGAALTAGIPTPDEIARALDHMGGESDLQRAFNDFRERHRDSAVLLAASAAYRSIRPSRR